MKTVRIWLFIIVLVSFTFSTSGQIGHTSNTLSLPAGIHPSGICWDGSYIWVVSYSDRTIHKIDSSTGNDLFSFEAPDRFPTGLAWDGNHLWCSGNRTNKIYQIDPQSGQVTRSFDVTSTPKGITCINGSLWYVDSSKKQIYQINPETGAYTDTIPAPGGASRGLAFDGKYLWCSDSNLKEVYKIDINYKKIIMILPAPDDSPYGLCWDGSALWVAGYHTGTLSKMFTTGTERTVYLDSLQAHLQHRIMVRNVGSTFMNLRTWISQPYTSIRQELTSDITYSPHPQIITTDQYGQKFAYYNQQINPGDSMVYTMDVNVTTYDLRYFISPDSVGTIRDVSASIQNSYLADGQYFDIHSPIVLNAVNQAIGDETNMYWKARKIHDYIIQKIHYVLDGRWDPAPQILTQGHGSCSEYSYLFVAMCRAAHIPARYEAGAYNGGVLPYVDQVYHRWSQIYLPPYGWIHVDATWDDRDYPANQSRYFGGTSKRLFATTLSGGGSNKISWTYNSANSSSGGSMERDKKYTWSRIGSSVWHTIPVKEDVVLFQNYPNPFNDQTTISFKLVKPSMVKIRIINLQGTLVKELFSAPLNPGEHRLLWDGSGVAPGTYLIQLITSSNVKTKPCIISR